jgi:hypothetical protein
MSAVGIDLSRCGRGCTAIPIPAMEAAGRTAHQVTLAAGRLTASSLLVADDENKHD